MADVKTAAAGKDLAAENKSLKEANATLAEQNKQLTKAVEQLEKENTQLKAKAFVGSGKKSAKDNQFEHGGDTYCFTVPSFRYKGEKITALDAMADKAILADLVAMKAGVIKQIN